MGPPPLRASRAAERRGGRAAVPPAAAAPGRPHQQVRDVEERCADRRGFLREDETPGEKKCRRVVPRGVAPAPPPRSEDRSDPRGSTRRPARARATRTWAREAPGDRGGARARAAGLARPLDDDAPPRRRDHRPRGELRRVERRRRRPVARIVGLAVGRNLERHLARVVHRAEANRSRPLSRAFPRPSVRPRLPALLRDPREEHRALASLGRGVVARLRAAAEEFAAREHARGPSRRRPRRRRTESPTARRRSIPHPRSPSRNRSLSL